MTVMIGHMEDYSSELYEKGTEALIGVVFGEEAKERVKEAHKEAREARKHWPMPIV